MPENWSLNLWESLEAGASRDAAAALIDLFTQYGLGSLAPSIVSFIKGGHSADTVALLLQDRPEYKQRFIANEARRAKGLPVLTPAEYLATEKSYRQIMSAAGLPVGFYDQAEDFRAFLEADVSPQEVQGRVQQAAEFVNNAPAEARQLFRQWYTDGDMIAYALDPKRATSAIDRAYAASTIAGYGAAQNAGITQGLAERIAAMGVEKDAASQGFGVIAQEMGNAAKLAQIEGTQLTVEDLASETFLADSGVAEKRRKLASSERGRFGGSSGTSQSALAKPSGGTL